MILKREGQVLVLFIIILPILLILLAIVIDIGVVLKEKNRINDITTLAIKEGYIDNKIEDILKINKVDIDNLKIERLDNKIKVLNTIKVKSIFGNIIGINEYKIKIEVIGHISDGKVLIE